MPSVTDFEQQVFEKEGVRIILRTKSEIPKDYGFSRKLSSTATITDLKARLDKSLDGKIPYSIVVGDGNASPHGNTKLENVRNSYAK